MKNLTLNKSFALVAIAIIVGLLIQACRKETFLPSKGANSLTIAEAKNYFENNFQTTVKSKNIMSTNEFGTSSNASQNPMDGKLPMWDASILKNLSTENNAVLVPMHKEGLYVHISEKTMVKFGFLNYMMMYKDKENNIVTEWIELKPTEKWVSSKFSRDYEGKILVKDWDGKIKKIYSFGDTKPAVANGAISLKLNKIASIDGSKMDTGNGDIQCTVTTTVTIRTEPKVCPCQGHTYEQFVAGICPCPTPPTKGYTRTIQVAVEYDCTLPPEGPDGPTGGTGNSNNGSGSGYSPSGNPNGGGSPNPSDYTPISCNPDPNYVVPTIPPPPGTEYILPCSATQIPTEPTPNPNNPTSNPLSPAQFLINILQIQPSGNLMNFIEDVNNASLLEEMVEYVYQNGNTQENRDFLYWGLGYLVSNTSVTNEVFINQFLGKVEAKDGDFDEEYWNNPNISIPQQNLPTWANFSSNFPTHDKPNSVFADYAALLTALGGDVGALYVPGGSSVNTCAIRVSYALVRSGVTIPDIPSRTVNGKTYPAQTLKDKDGKYYFIRAKELNAWMRKTFGTNDGDPNTPANSKHSKITKAQAGTKGANLPTLLSGKKGIYCLVSDKPSWSSGHADLLYDNATCGVQCHFDGPIDWIDVWILQ